LPPSPCATGSLRRPLRAPTQLAPHVTGSLRRRLRAPPGPRAARFALCWALALPAPSPMRRGSAGHNSGVTTPPVLHATKLVHHWLPLLSTPRPYAAGSVRRWVPAPSAPYPAKPLRHWLRTSRSPCTTEFSTPLSLGAVGSQRHRVRASGP